MRFHLKWREWIQSKWSIESIKIVVMRHTILNKIEIIIIINQNKRMQFAWSSLLGVIGINLNLSSGKDHNNWKLAFWMNLIFIRGFNDLRCLGDFIRCFLSIDETVNEKKRTPNQLEYISRSTYLWLWIFRLVWGLFFFGITKSKPVNEIKISAK